MSKVQTGVRRADHHDQHTIVEAIQHYLRLCKGAKWLLSIYFGPVCVELSRKQLAAVSVQDKGM